MRHGHEGERFFGGDDIPAQGLHGFAEWETSSPHSRLDVFESDVQQAVIDVVAAKVRVAVGSKDFEDAVVQLENGNIERPAAEIVNRDDA